MPLEAARRSDTSVAKVTNHYIPSPLFQSQTQSSMSSTPQTRVVEGYDPAHSTTTPEALQQWLNSPIIEDLQQVPGIGPATKAQLAVGTDKEEGIFTTFELLGKFLMLKGPNVSPVEHCDRFWFWLKSKGISGHRSAIVQAVAERIDTMMPGVYDGTLHFCGSILIYV